MKRVVLTAVTVLGLGLLASAQDKGRVEKKIDGLNKPVFALLPEDFDASRSYGMVLFLHGTGGDGDKMIQWTRVYSKSPIANILKAGYILVCPSSNSQAWGVTSYDRRNGGQGDIAAVAETIKVFTEAYNVDPYRIHMVGFSAGSVCIAKAIAWSKEFRNFRVHSIMCHSGGFNGSVPAAKEDKSKETRVWVLNGSKDKPHDAPSRTMKGVFDRGGYDAKFNEIPDKEHIFPVIEIDEMVRWWEKIDEPYLKRADYEKTLRQAQAQYKEKAYAAAFKSFRDVFEGMKGIFDELAGPAEKGMQEIEKRAGKKLKKGKKLRRKNPERAAGILRELIEEFAGTEAASEGAILLAGLDGG